MNILTIDQGTTGTKALIVNKAGRIVKSAYREFTQIYPQPGWVEHDPEEIWQTVVATIEEVMHDFGDQISTVGISNQRETVVIWDRDTGKPLYNAIVWQCRRTSAICNSLKPYKDLIRKITGLPLDAYFSGTKIKWLIENLDKFEPAKICVGTIDSWLIWNLTTQNHFTDYTNASRTMLYDIRKKRWSKEMCELLEIPMEILPKVRKSSADFGKISSIPALRNVPINGVAGDQQAALFGQRGFTKSQVKNTYGTGCFILMNLGEEFVLSEKGLITTLAVNKEGEPCYALEGSVFIAGAVIQWLRDEMNLIKNVNESASAAKAVTDNGGVYFVPAFVGLGAPYWNMQARGMITGITRGTGKNHLIRAALESIAYQNYDVIQTMQAETDLKVSQLLADGGATANDFLMQFQSDILDIPLLKSGEKETTALGAAYLAGL